MTDPKKPHLFELTFGQNTCLHCDQQWNAPIHTINPNEDASPEGYCEGHDMRFPADEGCPLCPKPINPHEGRPEEVGASGAQQQNEQAFWVVLNRFAAHDPGCSAHDAGACHCGLDEALAGLKVLQTLSIPERSLDNIWNAILDVKQQLKAINAELSKSDAARENDRLRTKLVNEGKVK